MITFRAKVFHTQGTNLAIAALSLITGVVLARFLGVEARGELAIIMIWPPILSLVGLMGLHEAAVYFVARSDEKVARRHISAAFMMATFFLALVTLAKFNPPLMPRPINCFDFFCARAVFVTKVSSNRQVAQEIIFFITKFFTVIRVME